MINVRKLVNPVQARKNRYDKICKLVNLQDNHHILDVGCGNGDSFESFNTTNQITGLDIHPEPAIFQDNFTYVSGDGENMQFEDNQFDVAVCVGVLEHIFPFDKLKKMCSEIDRVSKSYAIVVPHFLTPVEPHYQLPMWQHYPDSMKAFLIKRFKIAWYDRRPEGDFEKLHYFKNEIWSELFPGSTIVAHNHIAGLIWNTIVYKN